MGQNREAKQRSRVKKMVVVWGLVACIQDLYQANYAYQEEFDKHSGKILANGTALEAEAHALREENRQLRAKQLPPSPPKTDGKIPSPPQSLHNPNMKSG